MPTAVVTGANRGIGLDLVRQLVARDAHVFATCRTTTPDLAATGATVVEGVDVTSDEGAAILARAVGERPVDLLVHNAGLLVRDTLDDVDLDDVRAQLEVNAIAPLRLTRALLPRLGAGAKIAIVTSQMGSIADNTSGGYYGYRMSKAAVNMAGVSLARDLAPRGVAVVLLHPGYVRTGMTGHQGNIDPPESARNLLARIDALTLATTGRFWHARGDELPW